MYLCRCSHHKRYHTKFQDKEMTTLHTMGFSGIAMPLMEAYRMSAWGVGTKSCNTSLQRNYSRRPLHGSLKSSTSNFPHQVVDIQRIQEFNYRKYNYLRKFRLRNFRYTNDIASQLSQVTAQSSHSSVKSQLSQVTAQSSHSSVKSQLSHVTAQSRHSSVKSQLSQVTAQSSHS